MTFSLWSGGVAFAQDPRPPAAGCLVFTKADTEHSVTWQYYLEDCVPTEARQFWRSGDGGLFASNGGSILRLMVPSHGQASLSPPSPSYFSAPSLCGCGEGRAGFSSLLLALRVVLLSSTCCDQAMCQAPHKCSGSGKWPPAFLEVILGKHRGK